MAFCLLRNTYLLILNTKTKKNYENKNSLICFLNVLVVSSMFGARLLPSWWKKKKKNSDYGANRCRAMKGE
jgi:hypothetical protein